MTRVCIRGFANPDLPMDSVYRRELVHTGTQNLDAGPERDDRGRRLRIKAVTERFKLTPITDEHELSNMLIRQALTSNRLPVGHSAIYNRAWTETYPDLTHLYRVTIGELRNGKEFGQGACGTFTTSESAEKYLKRRAQVIRKRLTKKYGSVSGQPV